MKNGSLVLRVLGRSRKFTTLAVIEARSGRQPLRTEVVKNNKTGSCFCHACRTADECRHVSAARRFLERPALALVE